MCVVNSFVPLAPHRTKTLDRFLISQRARQLNYSLRCRPIFEENALPFLRSEPEADGFLENVCDSEAVDPIPRQPFDVKNVVGEFHDHLAVIYQRIAEPPILSEWHNVGRVQRYQFCRLTKLVAGDQRKPAAREDRVRL